MCNGLPTLPQYLPRLMVASYPGLPSRLLSQLWQEAWVRPESKRHVRRATTYISCNAKEWSNIDRIPYSGKFSHGANFRAFRARADFAKIRTAKFSTSEILNCQNFDTCLLVFRRHGTDGEDGPLSLFQDRRLGSSSSHWVFVNLHKPRGYKRR